ncbi:hypothetical protein GCM10010279_44860 [Streptomyces mutabilis]|nr:hypothetical protein GCM10010279_44860 [Streptomyces mutabilis]
MPDLICEVLAARMHRPVTLDDIGLPCPGEPATAHTGSLSGFVERATVLWRSDQQERPHILGAPALTGTPAVMPVWEWENPPEDVDVSRGGRHRVTRPTWRCCAVHTACAHLARTCRPHTLPRRPPGELTHHAHARDVRRLRRGAVRPRARHLVRCRARGSSPFVSAVVDGSGLQPYV